MTLGLLHFIRPEWLILIPLWVILWFWLSRVNKTTNWQDYLPPKALEVLSVGPSNTQTLLRWSMLLCGLLVVLAASGPSWVKQAVPAQLNQRALVILLDLSPSMMSTDVTPNRISRARYELLDALRAFNDGQIGLIAYAGTTHIVSPLTDDPDSISALVPSLSPAVMPVAGSNIESAIDLAQRLLDDAGIVAGQLLLITDGVDGQAVEVISDSLSSRRSLSVLGVGGSEPTPIPADNGGFVQNSKGDIVLTQLPTTLLRDLAKRNAGRYSTLRNDDSDINYLLDDDILDSLSGNAIKQTKPEESDAPKYEQWSDMGFVFILLALPFFLLLFRKGAIYLVMVAVFYPVPHKAQGSDAQELVPVKKNWSNLFRTKDQQAARLMSEGQYGEASSLFTNQEWSAAAHYRNGDYEAAAKQLEGLEDVLSLYNQANALAMSGKLPEAIEVYDKVLKQQAEHSDAAHNKRVIEEILNQQQEQQQEQQQSSENQSSEDQTDSDSSGSQSKESQSKESQSNNYESSASDQQSSNEKQSADQNQPGQQTESEQNMAQEQKEGQPEQQDEQTENNAKKQPSIDSEDNNAPKDQEAQTTEIAAQTIEDGASLSQDSEQWLRGIKDDPAGLLRRKFEYQAFERKQQDLGSGSRPPATSSEERY